MIMPRMMGLVNTYVVGDGFANYWGCRRFSLLTIVSRTMGLLVVGIADNGAAEDGVTCDEATTMGITDDGRCRR